MPRRLRVLTISKPYVAAAYRRKLALLAERDLDVGLICPPAWGAQTFEPWDGDAAYWLRRVPIVLNGKNHFHLYRGLGAAVAAFAPDVLNVEEEHYSLVTAQAFAVARRAGATPLFYTWQNIYKRYPPPFSWIEQAVFRAAGAGVAGNAEAADVLRAKGFRGVLEEIPQMGVDVALFKPPDDRPRAERRAALGWSPAAAPWIGACGRVVAEKGLATLVEALARLPDAQLLLVGDGPAAADLQAAAAALGVGARVHWRRAVPSREVAPLLQAIDVLCLPSLTRPNWKEQFGRILIEAMAAEAAVVGSSSGEIPQVIGDAGVIFPEGDAGALAAVLGPLLADAGRRRALAAKGRLRVQERYADNIIADRLAALILRLGVDGRRIPANNPS